eukprot:Hpha_TRINITY_DN15360_c1_g1::TRINITY_DN15360_c1_g1_i1::g.90396::m.90396
MERGTGRRLIPRITQAPVPFLLLVAAVVPIMFWGLPGFLAEDESGLRCVRDGCGGGGDGAPTACLGENETYRVVFDAGSTGSRVHVFHFTDGKLKREVFAKTRPGLSSLYRTDGTTAAVGSLVPLLRRAVEAVPGGLQGCTEVRLSATAGLRLLQESEGVLRGVRRLLLDSPFLLPVDGVRVASGEEEGIDGWVALNHLTGSFEGPGKDASNSAAILDLGGGSVQVVCASSQDRTSVSLRYQQRVWPLQVTSVLGYGLKEAGRRIDRFVGVGRHPCRPGTADFVKCQIVVRRAMQDRQCGTECESLVPALRDFRGEIYAFSYVHDRTHRWLPTSGRVSVEWLRELAVDVCGGGRSSRGRWHRGTMCKDLVYIHSLFKDQLQLPETRELVITSNISGYEASWPLGSALRRMDRLRLRSEVAGG